jgi:hypothetical protein
MHFDSVSLNSNTVPVYRFLGKPTQDAHKSVLKSSLVGGGLLIDQVSQKIFTRNACLIFRPSQYTPFLVHARRFIFTTMDHRLGGTSDPVGSIAILAVDEALTLRKGSRDVGGQKSGALFQCVAIEPSPVKVQMM